MFWGRSLEKKRGVITGLDRSNRSKAFATVLMPSTVTIETSGINYVLTRFTFGNLSFEEELRSATLFAREVMPRFAREAVPA